MGTRASSSCRGIRASSKDKALSGDYRIRWTGVDGYREFPITITE